MDLVNLSPPAIREAKMILSTYASSEVRGVRNLCQPTISSKATGLRGLGHFISSSEVRGSEDLGQPTILLRSYF